MRQCRWLVLILPWVVACGDSQTVKSDASSDHIVGDLVAGEPHGADAITDGAPTDHAPADVTNTICTNWEDMGLDCCDVCTAIYVTCKLTVKDSQQKVLTGSQCLSTCALRMNAYQFHKCMGFSVTCDAAKLQTCYDAI